LLVAVVALLMQVAAVMPPRRCWLLAAFARLLQMVALAAVAALVLLMQVGALPLAMEAAVTVNAMVAARTATARMHLQLVVVQEACASGSQQQLAAIRRQKLVNDLTNSADVFG
jgi:hypothetical protein